MRNALALLLLVPAVALGAEKAEKKKPQIPGVDWAAGTIKATGRGAPNLNAPSVAAARLGAEKAAEMDALRNILATLKAVQISAGKSVGDAMSSNDTVKATVEGQAKGFKRVDTRYFSDGGVELDVEMSLEGLLSELMPAEESGALAQLPSSGEMTNTGLVIDAGGLHPKPALAPRLLDEAGNEVYAARYVTKDALKANGIAGYLKTMDEAKKSARVGGKPLVVKAVKVAGGTDVVISNADADKLRDPKGNVSYLAEGRVIIVAD